MKRRVVIMVGLAALWIVLATLEVFGAMGNPAAYLGDTATSEHYAVFRELVLIGFFRQIYLPIIMALSAFFLWPRYGFHRLFKGVFGLFLAVRAGWLMTSSLGFPVFKWLYGAVMLAIFVFLMRIGKERTSSEET